MNSGLTSIIPPVGNTNKHVQSKEQTLEHDVHRHAKLARKELKAASKLEHKAQKEHARLEKALRKGDIARAEKHSSLEENLKAEALLHKATADLEEEAKGNSEYDLQTTKLSGSGGVAKCKDGAPAVLTSSTYNSYRPSYAGNAAW